MDDLASDTSVILTTKFGLRPGQSSKFADWQAKCHEAISSFPGFVSFEILSPNMISKSDWIVIQRFNNSSNLSNWIQSNERTQLINELKSQFLNPECAFEENISDATHKNECVTEVFVTQVTPNQEKAYRKWIAKIHQAEAKFKGFRGVYVQSPSDGKSGNWITLLQFDTPENLDVWIQSSERREILKESDHLIASLETHRIISPYAGWFASLAKNSDKLPPAWKQTMLVLLVLFPTIMLELKFLPLLISDFNTALYTFIGNAISVTLLAWPLMPIAIRSLKWWLTPSEIQKTSITFLGTFVILMLYLTEIILFWNFL